MDTDIIQARDLKDEQQIVLDTHLMQRKAAEVVPFMIVLELEEIRELVKNGSLYCICENDKTPFSTFYLRDTGIETQKGRKVYVLGGLSFHPKGKVKFLSQIDSIVKAVRKILDQDFKDKVIISATHEEFQEALIGLGFREISLREISSNRPELLAYFGEEPDQNQDAAIKWTGFIKE